MDTSDSRLDPTPHTNPHQHHLQPSHQMEATMSTPGCVTAAEDFVQLHIHTAKCSICDDRNNSIMRQCPACHWQICSKCFVKRGGGPIKHGNVTESNQLPPPPPRKQPFSSGRLSMGEDGSGEGGSVFKAVNRETGAATTQTVNVAADVKGPAKIGQKNESAPAKPEVKKRGRSRKSTTQSVGAEKEVGDENKAPSKRTRIDVQPKIEQDTNQKADDASLTAGGKPQRAMPNYEVAHASEDVKPAGGEGASGSTNPFPAPASSHSTREASVNPDQKEYVQNLVNEQPLPHPVSDPERRIDPVKDNPPINQQSTATSTTPQYEPRHIADYTNNDMRNVINRGQGHYSQRAMEALPLPPARRQYATPAGISSVIAPPMPTGMATGMPTGNQSAMPPMRAGMSPHIGSGAAPMPLLPSAMSGRQPPNSANLTSARVPAMAVQPQPAHAHPLPSGIMIPDRVSRQAPTTRAPDIQQNIQRHFERNMGFRAAEDQRMASRAPAPANITTVPNSNVSTPLTSPRPEDSKSIRHIVIDCYRRMSANSQLDKDQEAYMYGQMLQSVRRQVLKWNQDASPLLRSMNIYNLDGLFANLAGREQEILDQIMNEAGAKIIQEYSQEGVGGGYSAMQ